MTIDPAKVTAIGRLFAAALDKREGLRDDITAEVDDVVEAFATQRVDLFLLGPPITDVDVPQRAPRGGIRYLDG